VKDVTCWMTIKLHILIKYYKGSFMYKEYILTKDAGNQRTLHYNLSGCHSRDRMVVGFKTTYATVVSLNPVYGEVYLIQHYMIKIVSDL
jgi:hypothetical protein